VDCGTSNCKPQGLVRGTSVDAWDLVARSVVLDVFAGYNRLERIEIYMSNRRQRPFQGSVIVR
jgi:hypothetical protein